MSSVSESLRNEDGDYPWQTIRWGYGTALFGLLPAVALLRDGVEPALAGFALGTGTLVAMALLAWKWPI